MSRSEVLRPGSALAFSVIRLDGGMAVCGEVDIDDWATPSNDLHTSIECRLS